MMYSLPAQEQHRRQCEIRHWFNVLFVKTSDKSLKPFLSWAARNGDVDYKQRAALLVASEVERPKVAEALKQLPDVHRDQIEPFIKAVWGEQKHG